MRKGIETGLRNIREGEEAELAMLMEEEAMIRRHEKVERLRMAWQKKMEHQKYERMMRELSKLTLEELDEEMETIELLVNKLMLDETGGYTGKCNIITMEDVEMVDTAKANAGDSCIIWTDEQMDTVTMATGDDMDEELLMEDDVAMAINDLAEMTMDTLPGVLEMFLEEEEGKEEALSLMMGQSV